MLLVSKRGDSVLIEFKLQREWRIEADTVCAAMKIREKSHNLTPV
jgi:hypothetical protein